MQASFILNIVLVNTQRIRVVDPSKTNSPTRRAVFSRAPCATRCFETSTENASGASAQGDEGYRCELQAPRGVDDDGGGAGRRRPRPPKTQAKHRRWSTLPRDWWLFWFWCTPTRSSGSGPQAWESTGWQATGTHSSSARVSGRASPPMISSIASAQSPPPARGARCSLNTRGSWGFTFSMLEGTSGHSNPPPPQLPEEPFPAQ